jgi:hypothetical protein
MALRRVSALLSLQYPHLSSCFHGFGSSTFHVNDLRLVSAGFDQVDLKF